MSTCVCICLLLQMYAFGFLARRLPISHLVNILHIHSALFNITIIRERVFISIRRADHKRLTSTTTIIHVTRSLVSAHRVIHKQRITQQPEHNEHRLEQNRVIRLVVHWRLL